jgi:hypothetical protein
MAMKTFRLDDDQLAADIERARAKLGLTFSRFMREAARFYIDNMDGEGYYPAEAWDELEADDVGL